MPQVGFYVIESALEPLHLACRICRKSLYTGHTPLLVKFDQPAQMHAFDALLWQFDATSFIPHGIDESNSPICLSLSIPEQFKGECLNLGQTILDYPFARLLEIIANQEQAKIAGRERFKAYRALGRTPVIHQV